MNIIQTQTDILRFLEQVNSLHDGYLLSAQFENSGISRGNGLTLDPSKTVLRLRYLVTSICDAFENECILSVYDDRGCDIVFMTYEKMKSFYPALSPFFLAYDLAEMERRLQNRKQG